MGGTQVARGLPDEVRRDELREVVAYWGDLQEHIQAELKAIRAAIVEEGRRNKQVELDQEAREKWRSTLRRLRGVGGNRRLGGLEETA